MLHISLLRAKNSNYPIIFLINSADAMWNFLINKVLWNYKQKAWLSALPFSFGLIWELRSLDSQCRLVLHQKRRGREIINYANNKPLKGAIKSCHRSSDHNDSAAKKLNPTPAIFAFPWYRAKNTGFKMSCVVSAGWGHQGSRSGRGWTLAPVFHWSIFKQPPNSGQHHSLIYRAKNMPF